MLRRDRVIRWGRAFVLLPLSGLAACQGVRKPAAEVADVYVTDVTDEGSRLAFTLRLANPNDIPLPVKETNYTVSLGDRSFAFSDLTASTMPPGGERTLLFPAAFAVPEGALAGQTYRVEGTVTYEPPGEIREALTESGLPLPSVRFSREGRVEWPVDLAEPMP